MADLKPCPFCGTKPEVIGDERRTWGLVEHEDGCLFPNFRKHEIPESDFAAWNTRAELGSGTCYDTSDSEHDFTCSECGASMYTQIDDCWTMIAKGGLCDDVIERPNYCPNCGGKAVGRMAEYIVSVPDEQAAQLIEQFGIDGCTLGGFQITGEVVRCRDCRFRGKGVWGAETFPTCKRRAHEFQVSYQGYCDLGERRNA